MKKLVCLLLALSMCLSLAACGKSGESESSAVKGEVQEEHPEFVYAAEYIELDLVSTESWLTVRGSTDEGFYVTGNEVIGNNTPEGVTPRYEGEYDVYGTMLYFVGYDGKMKKLESFSGLPAEVDEEGRKGFTSSSNVSGMCFSDDGFVTVEMIYNSWNGGTGNEVLYSDAYWMAQKYEQKFFIRWFDKEGNERSCAPIEVPEGGYLDAYRMKLDSKGNVLITGGEGLRAIAPDGSDAYKVNYSGYIDTIVNLPDGTAAFMAMNDEAGGYMIHKINTSDGSVDEGVKVSFDAYSAIKGNSEYDIFYSNGTNFYGWKLGEAEPEKLFNWIACDVNGGQVNLVGVSDEGVVTGLINKFDNATQKNIYEIVRVRKVPYESVPQKQTLTLATMYIDYNVQDLLVKFNRSNKDYRVEIIDYTEQTGGDMEAAVNKLNTEIMAGNVPDILCLNGLNYTQLASKGIIEDLYPYIDSDKELSKDDFFPSILGSMEVGGKLCSTISGVYVNTLMGASSVVGDKPGWTYDEFNAALASMPDGCTALDEYVTRDSILQTCLALDMDSFVDWGSGKCSFDSEQFVALLKFANSFPSEFDWENYNYENAMSTEDRLARGQQMLLQTSAYSIDDIFYNNYTYFLGSEATYIGYPTYSGTGNMFCSIDSGYAMSSKSEHKDAVWQLLRQFFTEEYQTANVYAIASRRDVFEAKAKEATTIQYQTDAEGKQLLNDKGEPIPIVRYNLWDKATNKNKEIYALEPEQVDKIRQLVETTTKMADYDNKIIGIVTEASAPFFAGQKSAEDVAKLVQSKVNIYVNEQR